MCNVGKWMKINTDTHIIDSVLPLWQQHRICFSQSVSISPLTHSIIFGLDMNLLHVFLQKLLFLSEKQQDTCLLHHVFHMLPSCVSVCVGDNWVQLQTASLPHNTTPWANTHFPTCQSCLEMNKSNLSFLFLNSKQMYKYLIYMLCDYWDMNKPESTKVQTHTSEVKVNKCIQNFQSYRNSFIPPILYI